MDAEDGVVLDGRSSALVALGKGLGAGLGNGLLLAAVLEEPCAGSD